MIILFPPKLMKNAITDFDIVNFSFVECDVPQCPLMECIYYAQ